jgi:hypothetical protein
MRVAYTWSVDDYLELIAVARKNRSSKVRAARRRYLIWWVIIAAALIGLLWDIRIDSSKPKRPVIDFQPGLIIAVITVGLIAIALFLKRLNRRSSATRALKRIGLQDLLISMEITDNSLLSSAGPAETKWKWDAFDRVIETDQRFFLRLNDSAGFIMIPKKELGPESEIDAARSILENSINRKTSAFPVIPVAPSKQQLHSRTLSQPPGFSPRIVMRCRIVRPHHNPRPEGRRLGKTLRP